MKEKEQYIIEIERRVQLLSVILAISIILNVILVSIILFQDMDKNTDKEASIIIEQHDAPITIYNNITIYNGSNQTRSVITESIIPFGPS